MKIIKKFEATAQQWRHKIGQGPKPNRVSGVIEHPLANGVDARTQFVRQIRQRIEHTAVAFWAQHEFLDALGNLDLGPLLHEAKNAPLDPQDKLRTRSRSFGGGVIYPWVHPMTLNIISPHRDPQTGELYTQYFQPAEINADAGGAVRRFAAVPEALWNTPAMFEVIRLLLDSTPHALVSRKLPIVFHVHIITLRSDGTLAGISLPDHLHRDLEPITFVVSLGRSNNAGGGVSHIARPSAADLQTNFQDLPEADLIAEHTLKNAFEGFGFWDSRIAHDVSPIFSTDQRPAYRSALLIDFGNIAL